MRAWRHPLVPILVLVAWMAPAVGTLGVALHVALDHHGPHGDESPPTASALAGTASHGHHHDLATTSDHQHEARVEEPAPALRPGAAIVAVLPAPASMEAAPTRRPHLVGSSRRAPPDPLFTLHCSLLL